MIAPPARSLRTTGASAVAGFRSSAKILDPARNLAGDVEKILDAHNRAVHRAERDSGFRSRIGGIGRGLGLLTIDGEAGPCSFPLRIVDAGKRGLKPFVCGIPCHGDCLC